MVFLVLDVQTVQTIFLKKDDLYKSTYLESYAGKIALERALFAVLPWKLLWMTRDTYESCEKKYAVTASILTGAILPA